MWLTLLIEPRKREVSGGSQAYIKVDPEHRQYHVIGALHRKFLSKGKVLVPFSLAHHPPNIKVPVLHLNTFALRFQTEELAPGTEAFKPLALTLLSESRCF